MCVFVYVFILFSQIRFGLRDFEFIDMVGISFFCVRDDSCASAANHIVHIVRGGAIDIRSTLFYDLYKILSHSHDIRFNCYHNYAVRYLAHTSRIHLYSAVQSIGPF